MFLYNVFIIIIIMFTRKNDRVKNYKVKITNQYKIETYKLK